MKHSSTGHDPSPGISCPRPPRRSLGLFSWDLGKRWGCGFHPTGAATGGAQSWGVGSLLSLGTSFAPGKGVCVRCWEEPCPARSREQWWCVEVRQVWGDGQLLPLSACLLTQKSTPSSCRLKPFPSTTPHTPSCPPQGHLHCIPMPQPRARPTVLFHNPITMSCLTYPHQVR